MTKYHSYIPTTSQNFGEKSQKQALRWLYEASIIFKWSEEGHCSNPSCNQHSRRHLHNISPCLQWPPPISYNPDLHHIVTAAYVVCGKVTFSLVSVCPWGRGPRVDPWPQFSIPYHMGTPPPPTSRPCSILFTRALPLRRGLTYWHAFSCWKWFSSNIPQCGMVCRFR